MALDRSTKSFLGYNSADGVVVGLDTTVPVAFYGKTPIAQRSGAAQATSLVGTASSSDVTTELKAYIIEIGNTLTALGLWKGGA